MVQRLGMVSAHFGSIFTSTTLGNPGTGAASPKDIGRVMKAVMAKLSGQNVDGKTVNELVRKKLAS